MASAHIATCIRHIGAVVCTFSTNIYVVLRATNLFVSIGLIENYTPPVRYLYEYSACTSQVRSIDSLLRDSHPFCVLWLGLCENYTDSSDDELGSDWSNPRPLSSITLSSITPRDKVQSTPPPQPTFLTNSNVAIGVGSAHLETGAIWHENGAFDLS